MIIDSHCHLNMKDFENDMDIVIQNALDAGVTHLQTICTKMEDIDSIIHIVEKFDNVFGSVGVHPHDADKVKDLNLLFEQLISFSSHNKIISIGETGLDYFYEYSDRNVQQNIFRKHIHASQETQLPVIIHTRDADEDMVKTLKEEMKQKPFPGLLHCFSSSEKLALEALDLGLLISVSGMITFKNADSLRSIIKKIPIEKLLVETDAPYLAPVPMRGKRNEPAFTTYVVSELAKIKNTTELDIKTQTRENFLTLFTKAKI